MSLVPNILITGANGQLGSELRFLLDNNTPEALNNGAIFFTDQAELDITNAHAVERFLELNSISVIINCAAYTAVDKAQDEPDFCEKVNSIAPANLAKAAKANNALLLHISTDYVFNGKGPVPYKESDKTDPQSVYGSTKVKGEEAIINSGAQYILIRTSWLYSQYGNNFVKTIQKLSYEKPSLNVVFDQIGTPTYARDLAGAIIEICVQYISLKDTEAVLNFPFGIYHYSNEGVCSWFDFALEIASQSCKYCIVFPVTSDQFPTKAKRPPYSVLDKTKIKQIFGITIPHWRESLLKYYKAQI